MGIDFLERVEEELRRKAQEGNPLEKQEKWRREQFGLLLEESRKMGGRASASQRQKLGQAWLSFLAKDLEQGGEDWREMAQRISQQRPDWLPERVPCHRSRFVQGSSLTGGCLPKIVDPPAGARVKTILARDGSPLLEMALVPAGEFLMGTIPGDSKAFQWEKPRVRVFLDSYWIARTPVTQKAWLKFIQESGYRPGDEDHDGDYLAHWPGERDYPPEGRPDHPVRYLSYINAWAFCDFYGLMLPSQAQWEKAMRGRDGRRFPWSGKKQPTPQLANFGLPHNTQHDDTTPVHRYPKAMSLYGLLDGLGNVWEWCADAWNGEFLSQLKKKKGMRNPLEANNNGPSESYTLRGGCAHTPKDHLRCSFRMHRTGCDSNICTGFRPAQPAALRNE